MAQSFTWPASGSLSGTQNVNLLQVGGASITLGTKTAAASLPVTLASDQGAITENLTQVGGAAISLGTKTASASLPVILASDQTLPLPSGASTSALQTSGNTSLTSIATNTAKIPSQGAAVTAASTPVNIASDQTVPVSMAAVPTGGSTAALQTTGNTSLATIATNTGRIPAQGAAVTAASTPVNIASDQTVPVSATALPLPTGASTSALQTTGNTSLASIVTNTGRIPAQGTAVTAASTPVNIASDQIVPVSQIKASTSAVTSVAAAASDTSLLASNSSRKGAAFFNSSTATLYLKLGTASSTSSYTVQIGAQGYYELPFIFVYTGAINGTWSSATGTVLITELT